MSKKDVRKFKAALARSGSVTMTAAERLKYDDSEPRDDHGRWSGSGSGPKMPAGYSDDTSNAHNGRVEIYHDDANRPGFQHLAGTVIDHGPGSLHVHPEGGKPVWRATPQQATDTIVAEHGKGHTSGLGPPKTDAGGRTTYNTQDGPVRLGKPKPSEDDRLGDFVPDRRPVRLNGDLIGHVLDYHGAPVQVTDAAGTRTEAYDLVATRLTDQRDISEQRVPTQEAAITWLVQETLAEQATGSASADQRGSGRTYP